VSAGAASHEIYTACSGGELKSISPLRCLFIDQETQDQEGQGPISLAEI
jgi:hypothetical protein